MWFLFKNEEKSLEAMHVRFCGGNFRNVHFMIAKRERQNAIEPFISERVLKVTSKTSTSRIGQL